jgi:hypothetical protein
LLVTCGRSLIQDGNEVMQSCAYYSDDDSLDLICHATDTMHEDTFLLGPDLIDQLILKRKIMLKHWTDIEGYKASPFK